MAFSDFFSSFIPTVYADEEVPAPEPVVEANIIEEVVEPVQPETEDEDKERKEAVAEEQEEQAVEEVEEEVEEEEEEPEDPKEQIMEECTKSCSSLKKHLDECNERVENGSSENCIEEFFHFMHCADECAAPKIFAATK